MRRMIKMFALPVLAATLTCLPAIGQDHQDQQDHHDQAQSQDRHDNGTYRQHADWKRGYRMSSDDWNRGDKVDYRANHLSRPTHGREWRNIDGNYVLANQDGTVVSVRRARHDDEHGH